MIGAHFKGHMKSNYILLISVLLGLAIVLYAVLTMRYVPAGGAGNGQGVYILDRITGDVCVAGLSGGNAISVCIPLDRR